MIKSPRRLRSQRGTSIMLFIGAILPGFFIAFGMSVDMSRYYQERAYWQGQVNQAAVEAIKYSPYESLVVTTAQKYLGTLGIPNGPITRDTASQRISAHTDLYDTAGMPSGAVDIKFESGKLSIDLQNTVQTNLLKFFSSEKSGIQFAVRSRAHTNDRIVDLYMDTSFYLAPRIFSSGAGARQDPDEERWGKGDFWPESDELRTHPLDVTGQSIPNILATQQCYNPAFSALKESTIRMYDYFSASVRNQVGLNIGPVPSAGGSLVAQVLPITSLPQHTDQGMGTFLNQRHSYVSDAGCFAMAENEKRHLGYQTPPLSNAFALPVGALSRPFTLAYFEPPHHWQISAGNTSFLTAREILWSKSIEKDYPDQDFDGQGQKVAGLSDISRHLVNRILTKASALPTETRKTRSYSAIILLGDLPWDKPLGAATKPAQRMVGYELDASGLAGKRVDNIEVLQKIEDTFTELNARVRAHGIIMDLSILYFKHPGNFPSWRFPDCENPGLVAVHAPDVSPCVAFHHASHVFERFISDHQTSWMNLSVHVLKIPSAEGLTQSVASTLPLIGNSVLLVN